MARSTRLLLVVLTLVGCLMFSATPARAYGQATWQVAANGTGVVPGSGVGFGFWGWCAFAGGVTSGNDGDCQFAQYFHGPSGSGFTCEISMDITAWTASGGTFVITGSASARPVSNAAACLALFPGAATYTNVDTGIPAAANHYNLGGIGGVVGEFNIQVVQIP
jgi:hypothetical protein